MKLVRQIAEFIFEVYHLDSGYTFRALVITVVMPPIFFKDFSSMTALEYGQAMLIVFASLMLLAAVLSLFQKFMMRSRSSSRC